MASEYVKLSKQESVYGDKNMLQSQLFLISLIKKLKIYHELRNEELTLKIKLKRKIEETQNSIKILEKILPKTKIKYSAKNLSKKSSRKETTLEREIREIKEKLKKFH